MHERTTGHERVQIPTLYLCLLSERSTRDDYGALTVYHSVSRAQPQHHSACRESVSRQALDSLHYRAPSTKCWQRYS